MNTSHWHQCSDQSSDTTGTGYNERIFTGRNEVLAKVIFLHLSVILFTGGGTWPGTPLGRYTPLPGRYTPWQVHPPGQVHPSGQVHPPPGQVHPLAGTPPWAGTPPLAGTPPGQVHPPGRYTPRAGPPPPPGNSRLGNTVNVRPVRILLECILVMN